MLQLRNSTPFAARLAVMPDEGGIESIYIIVKASFRISSRWTLLEEQPFPNEQDCYWGEPGQSSLKYPSDFHPEKPATDFAVIGSACAPDMKAVRTLDVDLAIAGRQTRIRVYGDRVWDGGRISSPDAFETMPIIYERAFGGSIYQEGQLVSSDARNPVGQGFAGGRSYKCMEGERLPNLEDPRTLIASIDDTPDPACFGFCAPHWSPRAGFAGTYDDGWQKERAPYLPLDFDKRFFNAAHPALVCDGFLRGGERVEISNMHPEGDLDFALPKVQMVAHLSGPAEHSLGFNLETILVEPGDRRLSMVWKSKFSSDRSTLEIKTITINLRR